MTLDDVDGGFTLIYVFRRQYNQLGPGSMSFEDYCAQTKTQTISGQIVQQGPHVSDDIKFMGILGHRHSLAVRLKQSKLVDVRICHQRHH